MDADSWLWNLVQQISLCVLKSVFGTGRWLWDCATECLCYTAGCTAVKVATKYEFVYVSLRPKTCRTFFFNTSRSLYKMRVVYYITCKALLLSLPSIPFLSVIPFHPTVWHKNLRSSHNYAAAKEAERHPAHSDTSGFHKWQERLTCSVDFSRSDCLL